MQVLQLTPEQIAMLPPEQRQSILILKEQIQKTAGGAPWGFNWEKKFQQGTDEVSINFIHETKILFIVKFTDF